MCNNHHLRDFPMKGGTQRSWIWMGKINQETLTWVLLMHAYWLMEMNIERNQGRERKKRGGNCRSKVVEKSTGDELSDHKWSSWPRKAVGMLLFKRRQRDFSAVTFRSQVPTRNKWIGSLNKYWGF